MGFASQNNSPTCKISKSSFGREVYYEITSACDLACRHCCGVFKNEKLYVNPDNLIAFNQVLIENGLERVILTGGEPTLHPQFIYLLENIASKIETLVTTNGVKWGASEWCEKLKRFPLLRIQVSLDGATEKVCDFIRERGVWQKVISLLQNLSNQNLGHRVGISMTVTQFNSHEVDKILKIARVYNLSNVHFPQLLPVGKALDNWEKTSLPIKDQIRLEEHLLSKHNEQSISQNRLQRVALAAISGTSDCLRSITLKVDPKGNILPCPVASGENYSLGNIGNSVSQNSDILLSKLFEVKKNNINKLNISSSHSIDQKDFSYRTCEDCVILGELPDRISQYGLDIFNHHLQFAHLAMESEKYG
jgi:radical SAM protein with 4Fe4S-binding SPASM domain